MKFITKRIRQIFFMNLLQKRVISAVLAVCMVFSFMQMPGLYYSAKADTAGITTTATKITLNGSELTEDTVVKDGDLIKIEFDWLLANTDKTTKTFEVDLKNMQNISVAPSGQKDLKDNSGNVVGYYEVVDGKMIIVINNDEFLVKDGRKGGVVIEGEVDVNNNALKDGDPVKIGIADKQYDVTYNTGVATSGLNVQKAAAGQVTADANGNFLQKFTLNISSYGGPVTGINIADTYEAALGAPTGLVIESSGAGEIEEGRTFSSFADLNAYLSGKTMAENTSFRVSYTQTVNHAASGTKNTASVTYTNNKDGQVTKSSDAYAALADPTISKGGVLNGDGKSVTWTIRIQLNDYAKIGDAKAVIGELLDTPMAGMNDSAFTIDPANLTALGNGVYTYTYTADISDAYLNSSSSVAVKNNVKMTMKDGSQFEATGSVGMTPSVNWLSKEFAGYDSANKILTWNVIIGPLPDGVRDIAVSDICNEPWASNMGNMSLQWGMSVDGVQVIDENGNKTAAFGQYLSNDNVYWTGEPLKLKNDYVAARYGQTITVTFRTKVADESLIGKVYNNRGKITYTDPSLGTEQSLTADAQYKDIANLVTKTGEAVRGKNAIRYKVKMYLAGYGAEAGKNIVLSDDFPEDLAYAGDVKATVEDPWGNAKVTVDNVTYDATAGAFTIGVSDAMASTISADAPYLVLTYTLNVADEAEFTMNGAQTFTNHASATYEGAPLGADSSSVILTPQQIVTKTGNYTAATAPYAEYEVYINPSKMDLLPDGGTLTATDTLGSALSYDITTISVSRHDGNAWEEMAKGDYSFTYEKATNSIVFSGLPDETWLCIRYKARVNLQYGESMTPENSTNSFALEGSSSTAVEASKGFSVVAVKPDGWATSEEGEIQLYKFWTDNGQMVALPEAVFEVRKVKYDAETNTMVEDPGQEGDVDYTDSAVLETGITVDANGTVKITKLSYARIYALHEITAPNGYARNTEPYYFVLSGSEAELPPPESGIEVTTFSSGAQLLYENQKATQGTLEVTKSLSGVDAGDAADVLASLAFTVTKDGKTITGGSFKGSDMTLSGGVYKKTFANLEPGTYVVKETVKTVDGYIYKSSTYQVTVGESAGTTSSYTSGNNVNASVEDDTTTVAFTNTYIKTASLKITKTVSGDADWDDIKDTVEFKICTADAPSVVIATVKGSDMILSGGVYSAVIDGLNPDKEYIVTESGATLEGYTKTTTYKIDAGTEEVSTANEVSTGAVAIASGATSTVAFENAYEQDKGTFKITKTIDFDTTGSWNDIKDSLSFDVKSVATGQVIYTIAGKDMIHNVTEDYYYYELPEELPVGDYIVTENIKDISGVIVTTEYVITKGAAFSSATSGRVAQAEVEKDTETVVAYENSYKEKYATLVLKKSVTGARSWNDIKGDISFEITAVGAVSGEPGTVTRTWTINGDDPGFVSAGDGTYKYTIEGIDIDGTFTVEEVFASENAADYTRTTTVEVDNGNEVSGESATFDFDIPTGATVQFNNDYERNVGQLSLKKTVLGIKAADMEEAQQTIRFEVKPSPEDNAAVKVYTLNDFTKGNAGVYTLNISNVPTGQYHVKEVVYNVDGYETNSVEYTLTAANGSTTVVNNAIANGADLTVVSGGNTTIGVVDEYERQTGILEITKKVTGALGWDEVKEKLSFRVTNDEVGYDETFTYADFSDADGDGVYICRITGVEIGDYVVAETLGDVAGYACTTTYTVGAGNPSLGKEGMLTIAHKGQTAHVGFVNDYKSLTGSIMLKKSVTGDLAWSQVRDTLSFQLLKDGALVRTIAASQFSGPNSDGDYYYSMDGIADGNYTIKEVVTGENTIAYTRTTTVKVDAGSAVAGQQGAITFDADQGATAAIVNSYARNKGRLVLQKTLAGVETEDIDEALAAIKFTVTPSPVSGTGSKTYALSDFTKTVDGYKLEILDVPTGSYAVKETAYDLDGYDTESVEYRLETPQTSATVADGKENGVSAPISTGAATTVSVTDTYEKILTHGKLIITKTLEGDVTPEEAEGLLQFEVKENTTGNTQVYTLNGDFTKNQDGTYTLELDVIAGGYTITEKNYTLDGRDVSVTYTVNGSAAETGDAADATVVAGATTNVDFENEYTQQKGSLKLSKVLSGVDDADAADVLASLSFKITAPDGTEITVDGADLTEPGYSKTITGLPVGTYSIVETVADVAVYTWTSTVNSEDNGKTTAAVQVAKNAEAAVTFTNTYAQNPGTLVITKTLKGDVTKEEAEGALKFTVTNTADPSSAVVYTLKDFIYDAATGKYTLTLPRTAGTYTVEETTYDITGKAVTVKYAVDGGAQTSGTSASVVVQADGTSTVDFEDDYRDLEGKLVITKKIEGDVTKEEAEGALTFTVKDADGNEIGVYTLADDFDYDDQTGIYTMELPLAPGGYTVEETVTDIDGYILTSVTYNIQEENSSPSGETEGTEASVTVQDGRVVEVGYKDVYERKVYGSLKLVKEVLSDVAGQTPALLSDIAASLSFTITGPNGYAQVVNGRLLLDSADGTYTITGLEPGDYTIVERAKDAGGYEYVRTTVTSVGEVPGSTTTSTTNDRDIQVEVQGDQTTVVTYTNYYKKMTGELLIYKHLLGDITEEEAKGALKFKVTENTSGESTVYTLADFTYNATEDRYELKLPVVPGGYTVEETVYDVEGYITDSVTYSVNGGQENQGTSAVVSVPEDGSATVIFKDDYTKDEGKLVITKTIKGDVTKEEAEGALQFKVMDTATGKSKTYTLKDFAYDAATGTYTLELDVPSGTYTVEETIYDIKGYITSSVKYKVGTGDYKSGVSASAKVEVGGSVNVDFEDVYEKNVGKLVLTKAVKGDLIWDDIKDELSFVVKNKATGKSVTYKAADFVQSAAEGVYMLVIENLDPGEYVVTEKIEDRKGYLLETTYRVDGGGKQTGTKAEVTLTKEGVQLNFVNTYTSTKGKLVIAKSLLGNIKRKEAEGVLKFKVTNEQTNKSKTYTLEDFTYNKSTERYELELTLESGKYTVTETQYDVKGYELRSVTYQVGDGEKVKGNSAKVKVKAGKTTKLAFADRYIKKRTSDRTETTPQAPPTSTTTTTTTTTTDRDTPKTGDDSPLMMWLMMLLFGIGGTLGSVYGLRKNKKK